MKTFFSVLSLALTVSFFSIAQAFSLPSQVESVQIQKVSENSVRVSWREAESAEDIIIGYKVYFGTSSVKEEGETYDDEVMVQGGIETTIENLLPGTTYYFSVTALDSEENESENYSAEVEFLLEQVLTEEPEEEIEIIEEVVVEEEDSQSNIPCKLLPEKFLTCAAYTCDFIHPMKADIMTRSITGMVDGKCEFIETMPNDERLECHVDADMQVTLSQYYQQILEGKETENIIEQAMEKKQCVLLGKGGLAVTPLVEEIIPVVEEVLVMPMEEEESFGPEKPEEFKSAAPDVTAPVEAMNLSVDTKKIESDGMVVLSWEKSLDLDQDVVDQVLYLRTGLGNWDSGYSIGKDLETMELDVEKGENYEFKVISVDTAGNESESRVYSFSTKLAQSGPAGMFGIVLAILSLGILGFFSARRRAA